MGKPNFTEDIKVDKFNLDEECVNQSERFCYWAEEYSESVSERDELKNKTEILRAQLDKKIRTNPESYGLEKVTESAISNLIFLDKGYQKLLEEYRESVKSVNILLVAKEAFNHRKSMIEILAKLLLAGYYSVPDTKDREELSSERRETAKTEVLNNLNKKRKRKAITVGGENE